MDTQHLESPKPKMIAHRGTSALEMENTASAFVAAGNRSYFGIESDVHRTADGKFVIIHDDNTQRVALDHLCIEESTFDTLRAIQLCDKDGKRGRKDLIIPTLQEYIQICRKYNKVSILELKNHFEPNDLDAIIKIITEEGWLDNTIFISFDLPNLVCMREKLPQQKLQFLIVDYPDWLMDTLIKYQLDLDIHYRSLTEERVQQLHRAGIQIGVWTVEDLDDARRLFQWGVDYITSNSIE